MTAYWAQWDHTEILSLHGVEPCDEEDTDLAHDECDTDLDEEEEVYCRRCFDSGCNYCLMC